MAEVRTGDWNALGRDAGRLRTAVFVREQGIAADLEADALDASARHLVVYNRLGMPVATGRLLQQSRGWAALAAWRWTSGARRAVGAAIAAGAGGCRPCAW